MRAPKVLSILLFLVFSIASEVRGAEEDVPLKIRRAIAAATKLFQKNPEAKRRLLPADFSLEKAGKEIITEYSGNSSTPKVTRLNTAKNTILDLGLTLTADKDKSNLLTVYKRIYDSIPKKLKGNITPYGKIRKLTLPDLRKKTRNLLRYVYENIDLILLELDPNSFNPFAINPIADCSLELGYETAGSDSEVSARCSVSDYESLGLFANVDFPLKNNLTCIKDQGRRGTCVAHTIAANLETLRMQRSNLVKNLSEQHIYYTGESVTESSISLFDMQTYGLCGGCVLDDYENNLLPVYYEHDWNYNRSSFIDAQSFDAPTGTFLYGDSCAGNYTGEGCEDYSWQTGANVNLIAVPNPLAAPLSGALPTERLKDHGFIIADGAGGISTQIALANAILLVAVDTPVFLAFSVTEAFQASTDGYVVYSPNDDTVGGHAVELIAFVPNALVPVGAPQATEEGYFIVKNSWGIDAGDCGFYYLDYGFLRRYMTYISFFDLV